MPFVERILLENLVRNAGAAAVGTGPALALVRGEARSKRTVLPLHMSRVILQDGSGLPLLMDLAAQRDALARRGVDPERATPALPAEIIVDVFARSSRLPQDREINLARNHALE